MAYHARRSTHHAGIRRGACCVTGLLLAVCGLAAADTLELSLDQALRLALKTSPAAAQAGVSRTQGSSTLARGITTLIPTVSGEISYANTRMQAGLLPETLSAGWAWNGSLTLSQVVFDPGVVAALVSAANSYGYYRTDAQDKTARLIYDVTSAYLGLLKAELLSEAAGAALARARENAKAVKEKERLGSASSIDLLRSLALESQAELARFQAESGVRVAGEQLKATLGLGQELAVRPADSLLEPKESDFAGPESLLAEIRRQNPGLRLAKKSEAVARINCAAAIGKALPSVSAYWSTSYYDSLFPRSFGHWTDNDQVSYGLRLSFPLLDLKSYVLGIVDASNERRRARAASRAAALTLNATATGAVAGLQEARRNFDYARRNLKLYSELHDLAREQHRLGAISFLDLISVEADLAQSQATYVAALAETYIQVAQIDYLLGQAGLPGKE